jgi:hypothetical protein
MKLMSQEQFMAETHKIERVEVAFYSVVLALFLYKTCLYLSLRQPLCGYYLLFLTSTAILCDFMDGTAKPWFFPDSPYIGFRLNMQV